MSMKRLKNYFFRTTAEAWSWENSMHNGQGVHLIRAKNLTEAKEKARLTFVSNKQFKITFELMAPSEVRKDKP